VRIFFPLGMFSPATFNAKLIIQRTWSSNISWDDKLPSDIMQEWAIFVDSLACLNPIKIPWHFNRRSGDRCLLLGFCDASQRGCAAVIYLRVLDDREDASVSLVDVKTKLTLIKSLTIPLHHALWLHRVKCVIDAQLNIVGVHAWTDSTIVLSWLVNRHESFEVYMSNRVHKIHTLLPSCVWAHVSSVDNPGDCASLGVLASELPTLTLY
jgi:hypothetical protein